VTSAIQAPPTTSGAGRIVSAPAGTPVRQSARRGRRTRRTNLLSAMDPDAKLALLQEQLDQAAIFRKITAAKWGVPGPIERNVIGPLPTEEEYEDYSEDTGVPLAEVKRREELARREAMINVREEVLRRQKELMEQQQADAQNPPTATDPPPVQPLPDPAPTDPGLSEEEATRREELARREEAARQQEAELQRQQRELEEAEAKRRRDAEEHAARMKAEEERLAAEAARQKQLNDEEDALRAREDEQRLKEEQLRHEQEQRKHDRRQQEADAEHKRRMAEIQAEIDQLRREQEDAARPRPGGDTSQGGNTVIIDNTDGASSEDGQTRPSTRPTEPPAGTGSTLGKIAKHPASLAGGTLLAAALAVYGFGMFGGGDKPDGGNGSETPVVTDPATPGGGNPTVGSDQQTLLLLQSKGLSAPQTPLGEKVLEAFRLNPALREQVMKDVEGTLLQHGGTGLPPSLDPNHVPEPPKEP